MCPSSKNYIRDLKQERKTSLARGEGPKNAIRKQARRDLEKEGKVKPFDGLDVNHVKPLSKGGAAGKGNLEAIPTRKNRSFARNPDGSIKK
jgi:hypothetical protein